MAQKKDVFDLPKLSPVQNRQYYLDHGLAFQLGYMPLNSFNKGINAGASYTYFLSDFVAWEVLNANYVLNQDTALKTDLKKTFITDIDDQKTELDFIQYMLTTNIIYTPLYNKSLLFNKTNVYGEISFVFGGGIANFDSAGAVGLVDLGTILRFFTAADKSLKFDIRVLIPLGTEDRAQEVNMNLAIVYEIQLGSPPKEFDFDDVESFGF